MVIDKVSDRSNERLAKTYFFRRLAVGICHEKMRDGVEQRTPDELDYPRFLTPKIDRTQ